MQIARLLATDRAPPDCEKRCLPRDTASFCRHPTAASGASVGNARFSSSAVPAVKVWPSRLTNCQWPSGVACAASAPFGAPRQALQVGRRLADSAKVRHRTACVAAALPPASPASRRMWVKILAFAGTASEQCRGQRKRQPSDASILRRIRASTWASRDHWAATDFAAGLMLASQTAAGAFQETLETLRALPATSIAAQMQQPPRQPAPKFQAALPRSICRAIANASGGFAARRLRGPQRGFLKCVSRHDGVDKSGFARHARR